MKACGKPADAGDGDGREPALREALSIYWHSMLALGRGRLIRAGFLVLAGALLEGFGIVLIVPLLELIFAGQDGGARVARFAAPLIDMFGRDNGLLVLLGLAAAAVLLRGLVAWMRTMAQTELSQDLVDSWRMRLVTALVGANWRAIQRLIRGRMEFSLASDVSRVAQGSDQLLRGTVSLVQLVVLTGVAIAMAPMLSLAIIVLLLLCVPVVMRMARRSFAHGSMLSREGARRHTGFTELLSGIKLAKAHDAEERYAAEYRDTTREIRTAIVEYTGQRTRTTQMFRIAGTVAAGIVLIVGLRLFHTPPAVLSALLALMMRLTGPVMQLAQGAEAVMRMLPAMVHIVALERRLGGADAKRADAPAAPRPMRDGPAAIALEGVHYAHEAGGQEVLRGVDFKVGPGELVVLEGSSGAGKTTLADIAIGLLAPGRGRLTVDGAAVSGDEARRAWRREVAYVPQEPLLFDRPLGENLRWSAPHADDAAIRAALDAAEALEFVDTLPEGLATRAGDRGGRFSGGERQRLCLARALLRRPRLLVLDEPTSALDRATEQRLLETLARLRGGMSILLIAHRLPPDLPVDRGYRLSGGRLSGGASAP